MGSGARRGDKEAATSKGAQQRHAARGAAPRDAAAPAAHDGNTLDPSVLAALPAGATLASLAKGKARKVSAHAAPAAAVSPGQQPRVQGHSKVKKKAAAVKVHRGGVTATVLPAAGALYAASHVTASAGAFVRQMEARHARAPPQR